MRRACVCAMMAAVVVAGAAAAAAPGGAAARIMKGRDAAKDAAAAAPEVQPTALVDLGWRFFSNYVPQHYGNWQFSRGTWNFGNDKRIECEACGYVMYMLIDRLGDEFNHRTVVDEMNGLCPRVQWVFRSACQHFFAKHSAEVINMVMRLTEPEDICKKLAYCAPDFYDSAMMGGAGGMVHPGMMNPLGMPNMLHAGYGGGAGVSMQHPTMGYSRPGGAGYGLYPAPGTRPLSTGSPYSPYSYGGYDGFGFPMAHPGVPSSTPLPPAAPTMAAA